MKRKGKKRATLEMCWWWESGVGFLSSQKKKKKKSSHASKRLPRGTRK